MCRRVYSTALFLVLLCSPAAAQVREPYPLEYTTSDGVVIVGDYWTPLDMNTKAPAVVLLHMYRSDRSAWRPLIPALEQAGFAILAIDLRGHGQSTKPEDRQLEQKVRDRDEKLFRNMHQDVFGAYRWLQQRPEVDLSRLAVVGASVGCSVALDYAGRDKSVDVLVLLTPGENYLGLNSLKHVKQYGDRSVLMLSSEEDRGKGTDSLAQLASRAEVKTFSQTDIHGTRMFGKVAGADQTISAFLEEHVGKASGDVVYASVNGEVYHQPDSLWIKRIKKENLRLLSSAAEAEQRGLRPSKN